MTKKNCRLGTRLAAIGALATGLLAAPPVSAHEDPSGCFETGVAITVGVFRDAAGTIGVTGSISECETIYYRATLAKAQDSDNLCAFSEGQFTLTTPDGVVHDINLDVPCIGGTVDAGGDDACDPTKDSEVSSLIPYTVQSGDIVGGFVVATSNYVNGIAHDNPDNTAGTSATTPKSTPVVLCNDNDACTDDRCDPEVDGSAACSNTPIVCDDNNACTTEQCVGGECVTTPVICDDNDACTTDTCSPSTGCGFAPVVCNDNDACTGDVCNPSTGQCQFPPQVNCDDNNACTTDTCNPATGNCSNVDVVTPTCDDNDACTDEICNTTTGQCQTTDTTECNDNDICTDDTCNPDTGLCVFTPDPTNDESCQNDAICRTPGFWKTHGAVSQAVITLGGGCLEVCGEVITTATESSVGNANSVLEAMCISPRGEHRLQLVRQLTALALNCVISEFGPDCGGDTGLSDLFADCNEACLENDGVGECIAAIDCFNNGGVYDDATGLCGPDTSGSCHERALPDGLPRGGADTPQECNAASKNTCTVILEGEAACTAGNKSANPEVCFD